MNLIVSEWQGIAVGYLSDLAPEYCVWDSVDIINYTSEWSNWRGKRDIRFASIINCILSREWGAVSITHN